MVYIVRFLTREAQQRMDYFSQVASTWLFPRLTEENGSTRHALELHGIGFIQSSWVISIILACNDQIWHNKQASNLILTLCLSPIPSQRYIRNLRGSKRRNPTFRMSCIFKDPETETARVGG